MLPTDKQTTKPTTEQTIEPTIEPTIELTTEQTTKPTKHTLRFKHFLSASLALRHHPVVTNAERDFLCEFIKFTRKAFSSDRHGGLFAENRLATLDQRLSATLEAKSSRF